MFFSLSLAVMPMLTLSLHAGVCGSLAQPYSCLPERFLEGKREILSIFVVVVVVLYPAKIKWNKEEKPQIPGDSSEAKIYFPKVWRRTKPCSTRARLIWGILQRKEQGRGRLFFKKKKTTKQSQFRWQPPGITCSFLYKLFLPSLAQRCERFFCSEKTLLEKLLSGFFPHTCREKNSLARF